MCRKMGSTLTPWYSIVVFLLLSLIDDGRLSNNRIVVTHTSFTCPWVLIQDRRRILLRNYKGSVKFTYWRISLLCTHTILENFARWRGWSDGCSSIYCGRICSYWRSIIVSTKTWLLLLQAIHYRIILRWTTQNFVSFSLSVSRYTGNFAD
jgi:hypothetical protein